jgi:hypothetical protein
MSARIAAVWLVVGLLWCTTARAAEAVQDLACVRTGPTWALLQWRSQATRHMVQVRERRRGPWRTAATVAAQSYCVQDLKPGRDYRIRVSPADDLGARSAWREVALQTRAIQPLDVAGLRLWPPQRLATSAPTAMTWPALEAYRGRLYVLEALGCELWLARVVPDDLRVLWRTRLAPQVDETGMCYQAPDLCVQGETLWITWEAHPTAADASPDSARARLMYYDLARDTDQAPGGQVSAPLELEPRIRGRSTESACVAIYQDDVWVCWSEQWQDGGVSRGTIWTGVYDRNVGRVADPIPWLSCPTPCPRRPSLARFGADMVLLFTDAAAAETGTETLMAARSDGGRIYDVAALRRMGRCRQARGAQLYDRLYYVYASDASYPAGGGQYFDIALGRMNALSTGGLRATLLTGLPVSSDMKLNIGPDVAAVGDQLFVAFGKWEEEAVANRHGWGTWVARVGWSGEAETGTEEPGIEL